MALRMRSSFSFFFSLLIFHVNCQLQRPLPEGSINLDCGLNEGATSPITYLDNSTIIQYTPDDDHWVENGAREEVNKLPPDGFFGRILFRTKRTFHGGNGTRGCYMFNVTKGSSILLRAYFYYGELGEGSSPPEFDVYLGVNYWKTVKFNSDSATLLEIIHFPTSKFLHLCLLNTGHGDPYINYIELRPIGSTSPLIYDTNGSGSLQPIYNYSGRCWTDTESRTIRYPDDDFDREWAVVQLSSRGYDVTPSIDYHKASADNYDTPWEVVKRAIMPNNNITQILFDYTSLSESTKVYVVLHFAELQQHVKRYMNVSECTSDCKLLKSLDPPEYLKVSSYNFATTGGKKLFVWTNDQNVPPMLNAIEEYTIIPFQSTETDDTDVEAMYAIKGDIKDVFIANNNWTWIGDPCLPLNQAWKGVTCIYNGNDHPRITALNLSSLGLSGGIPPALAKLEMLQSLDLSYNLLTGTIPDFLSKLQHLNSISIQGNNMTGPWPSDLLHKQQQGSIVLDATFGSYSHRRANVGTGVIIAIPIVVLICISLVIFLVVKCRSKQPKQPEPAISPTYAISPPYAVLPPRTEEPSHDEYSVTPRLRELTIEEVNDLIHDKKILGKGGFGTVYLSCMDGNNVAVKTLDACNEKQERDFKYEVEILSTVHHKNLVRILGYCDHKEKRALVMEYVENNTLKHHLLDKNPENPGGVLSWDTRVSIIIGTAQGMEYLHRACDPPIIHRDIKPENILLTRDFEAKLADFGLSRVLTSQANISSLVGTPGYVDMMCHELNDKADIYSFGIVLLVVLTGKHPMSPRSIPLQHWVKANVKRGDIHSIVDPLLGGQYNENMAWSIVEIAMKCTSIDQSERPTMENVVKVLKSAKALTIDTSPSTSVNFSKPSDINGPESR